MHTHAQLGSSSDFTHKRIIFGMNLEPPLLYMRYTYISPPVSIRAHDQYMCHGRKLDEIPIFGAGHEPDFLNLFTHCKEPQT
jgi:hypothetical protein